MSSNQSTPSLLLALDELPDAWQCWTAARLAEERPPVRLARIRDWQTAGQAQAISLSAGLGQFLIGRREAARHRRILERLLDGDFWRSKWEREFSPTALSCETAADLRLESGSAARDVVVLLSPEASSSKVLPRGHLVTLCVSRPAIPWGGIDGAEILAAGPEDSRWRVLSRLRPQVAPGDSGDVLALKSLVECTSALVDFVGGLEEGELFSRLASAPLFQRSETVAGLGDWSSYLFTDRGRYSRAFCEMGWKD